MATKRAADDQQTVTKTLRFWLTDLSNEDCDLLHELSRELARCHRLFVQTALACTAAGCTSNTRLRLSRRAYQEEFGKTRFVKRFGNTYTGEVADKDFKRQMGLIRTGQKSSISFGPGSHANIDLLTEGLQCRLVKDGDRWYITGAALTLDEDKTTRAERKWGIIPQTSGGASVKAKQHARTMRQLEQAERTSRVRLVWRDGKTTGGKKGWEAQVVCRMPVVTSKPSEPTVCGIDVGMHCLLVASIPTKDKAKFIGGNTFGELWHEIERHCERRTILNKAHKRHAAAAHSDKISHIRKRGCELASRQLIDWCMYHHVTTIRLEDLSGIRDRCSDDEKSEKARTWNRRLSHWPWFQLQQRIEQKAAAYGITVEKVNPNLTSQTCSSCGYANPANREGTHFKCLRCGLERHADLNAANNIARLDPSVDFDAPNTPGRAAVLSDGPKSRPQAGRSERLVLPDNPVTPRHDVAQLGMAL